MYDTRDRSKAQISLEEHAADVNVISWNATTTFMPVSGGDDSRMKVWDLRALENHIASFNYHSAPITSIEWCPHESSMLATCAEVRFPVSFIHIQMHCVHLRKYQKRQQAGYEQSYCVCMRFWSAVSGFKHVQDNSLAVWDLALERDQEEEASIAPQGRAMGQEAPPQLLFLHAGISHPKELHWHPQIPGMLAITAAGCFNLFKPSNVFELSDQEI